MTGGGAVVTIGDATSLLQTLITQQSGMLARLETKFDTHTATIDARFRALESTTTQLQITTTSMEQRLKTIDLATLDLSHQSEQRSRQTAMLDAEVQKAKGMIDDLISQTKALQVDVGKIQTQMGHRPQQTTIPDEWRYWLLIVVLFGAVIVLGLSLYLRGS